ncbi:MULTISPECIES: hypothetical protein [Nocardia]|nr:MULTISPECIES: hypothetical protein [Nocardia]
MKQKILAAARVAAEQPTYSILDRGIEQELPALRRRPAAHRAAA